MNSLKKLYKNMKLDLLSYQSVTWDKRRKWR